MVWICWCTEQADSLFSPFYIPTRSAGGFPSPHCPITTAFSNLGNWICMCEYAHSEIPLLSFIPSSPFFEHLFICLSDSCDFSSYILCSYLYRGTYFFFILFESVTCFRQRRWSCVPIFHLPVNFIQDIFCGTIIQNADVFLSPLGLCFRSFV